MSLVISLPQGGSPRAPPAAAISRAHNAADAAYQRFLSGRGAGVTTAQVRAASPAAEIPRAMMVQPANGPIATMIPSSATTGASPPLVSSQAGSVVPQWQVATASSGPATPQPPSFATAVVRQSSVPMPLVSPDPAERPLLSATPSVGRLVSRAPSQPLLSATPSVQRMASPSCSAQRLVSAAPSAQRFVSAALSAQGMVSTSPTVPAALQPVAGGSPRINASLHMAPAVTVVVPNFTEAPRTAVPAGPPPKLTDNIPDPSSVDKQKLQHAKGLLERLQSETAILTQQNQVRKAMLAQFGAQQKAQYAAQVDSNLQRECMEVEQRGNQQLLQLQQATMGQTMALEQQAAGLTLRYQCQLVEEDRQQKDYQIQRQFYQSEMQIMGKMQKLVAETSGNQAMPSKADSAHAKLGSERNVWSRDTNSFDAYLGNPGGRPQPRGDVSI